MGCTDYSRAEGQRDQGRSGLGVGRFTARTEAAKDRVYRLERQSGAQVFGLL